MTIKLRETTVFADSTNAYPGDTRMKLTEDAMTIGGNVIPAGTMFQPISAGFNNALNIRTRTVRLVDE